MYWNKNETQYLKKIYANVLSRKTPYFRRPLTINHKPTNICIIKLTKHDNYLEKIGGFSEIDNNLCFLIQHLNKFDTFLFNTSTDILATDIQHRVIKIIPNVSPDNILHLTKKTHNVWVFKVGIINAHKIKLNDLVYTH